MQTTRRAFLQQSLATGLSLGVMGRAAGALAQDKQPLFKISLAQWSLNRAFFNGDLNPLNFARIAKNDYQIDAIEYVNQFYKAKKGDEAYLAELKKVADGEGVKSLLIMCDGEGQLGDPNEAKRKQAVANHKAWLEWAKALGCHSIRVNAGSRGSYKEQQERAANGLAMLCDLAAPYDLNVLVENHGGLSSNGQWLAGVMKMVGKPNIGTLPDFGNFRVSKDEMYDRYQGVKELMPFAKAVSAKSNNFDAAGNEVATDYLKMMQIVLDAGYHGYVGIEFEGRSMPAPAGIRATKKLLEKVRKQLS